MRKKQELLEKYAPNAGDWCKVLSWNTPKLNVSNVESLSSSLNCQVVIKRFGDTKILVRTWNSDTTRILIDFHDFDFCDLHSIV